GADLPRRCPARLGGVLLELRDRRHPVCHHPLPHAAGELHPQEIPRGVRMIGISSIKKAATVPASKRNRKNSMFLYVCLAFTSISVLCLGVLLLSVFINGTKHLFD